jgi:hypothetical protein
MLKRPRAAELYRTTRAGQATNDHKLRSKRCGSHVCGCWHRSGQYVTEGRFERLATHFRRKIDVCGIMRFLSVIGSGTGADRNAGLAVVQFGLHSRLAASEVREFLPVSAHRDK